jgi:RNA polymerase sigma-70 factor (ECF subfamily)
VTLHSDPDSGFDDSTAPGRLIAGGAGTLAAEACAPQADLAAAPRRLEVVITRHAAWVWRTLRRFGVPERDVADAAQQVFVTYFQHAGEVETGRDTSYLASVTVKVAANARRKVERSREVLGEDLEALPVATARTPEDLLSEKQLRQELDRGLGTLPFEQRAVFVLYELEGFTLPEIAEALAIPLGTATSRLRRARGHFEAWVAGRGGDEP